MLYSMSSDAISTRARILDAARALFEEQGYFASGLQQVARSAGVSRQAIYLHFSSKAELLTELHLRIFEIDVAPALDSHPIWTRPTALEALDDSLVVDAKVVAKVWRIHEALVLARRHHEEVDETLAAREKERYDELLRLGRWLRKDGALAPPMRPAEFADIYWGVLSVGTYRALVIERGWTHARYLAWVGAMLPTAAR